MPVVKVALLQLASHGVDQDANRVKGEAGCREAAGMGADISLFPEMWNVGYTGPEGDDAAAREAWQARAIGADDPFVTHFRDLAKELNMAIALTYLERWPGAPRNTAALIDRHGEIVLTYAKVHTCDFAFEAACTPGDDFHVAALDTAQGTVQVGIMICYDREFPESARVLMLKGAELILTPNSCTLGALRLGQYQARAYENMVGLAMTNYPAPKCNGQSCAFDAVAFAAEGGPELDTCIVRAGTAEEIVLATFDLERIRAYRRRETWGNAYRKPGAYGPLVSPDVAPPFLRPDSRRG